MRKNPEELLRLLGAPPEAGASRRLEAQIDMAVFLRQPIEESDHPKTTEHPEGHPEKCRRVAEKCLEMARSHDAWAADWRKEAAGLLQRAMSLEAAVEIAEGGT